MFKFGPGCAISESRPPWSRIVVSRRRDNPSFDRDSLALALADSLSVPGCQLDSEGAQAGSGIRRVGLGVGSACQ